MKKKNLTWNQFKGSKINFDHPMTHDRHPMQARLSVEKNNIPIFQMSINYTAVFQFISYAKSKFTVQDPAQIQP